MKTILSLICLLSFATVLNAQKTGTLDKSFGDTGVVITKDFTGNTNAIGLLSNGDIITAGLAYDVSTYLAAACYKPDGSLNKSFGNEGTVFLKNTLPAVALCIDKNDNIVLLTHSDGAVEVIRLKSTGVIDSSFGTDGIVITHPGKSDQPTDITIQPDGKIVAGGYIVNAENEAIQGFLIRYMPDGSLDNSFGVGGVVIFNEINYSIHDITSLTLQANGKIVIAGDAIPELQGLVYRFNADGSLDKSFGKNGEAAPKVLKGIKVLTDIKVGTSGNIVTGAFTNNMFVARLHSNGNTDSSFGINGSTQIVFGNDYSECYSLLLQRDGKIIASGWTYSAGYTYGYFALARCNPNGTIDSAFGENGEQTTQMEGESTAKSSVLQQDGKIVLGGDTYIGDFPGINYDVLSRYDNSGKQLILSKIKHYIQNHNNLESSSTADAKVASLNISLAPNPVNNVLTINGLFASTKYAVRITNESGNTVANKQINNVSSYQINVQGLSAGVYYINIISNNNQSTTLKFIKQ